jgi:hypothetical protein
MSERLAIGAVAILAAAGAVRKRFGSRNAAMWGDLPIRFVHPYVSPSVRQLTSGQAEVRRVAYALKQGKVGGDLWSTARQMATVISDVSDPILVPVPSSSGSTRVNRKLAEAIASYIEGATVCDELSRHGGGVQSSMERRKRGLLSLSVPQHRIVSRGHCPDPMFLVDNVVATGNTLRAAREAMCGGTGLVWAADFHALLATSGVVGRRGSPNTPFRFSGQICPSVPADMVDWSTGEWWHPVPVEQIEWSEFRAAVELVPDDVSASGFLCWKPGWGSFEEFVGGDDGWSTEPGGGTHQWFRGTLPSGKLFFVWQGSGIEHWWTPGGVEIDLEREQAIITELEPKLDAIALDRDVSVADTLRLLDLGGEP